MGQWLVLPRDQSNMQEAINLNALERIVLIYSLEDDHHLARVVLHRRARAPLYLYDPAQTEVVRRYVDANDAARVESAPAEPAEATPPPAPRPLQPNAAEQEASPALVAPEQAAPPADDGITAAQAAGLLGVVPRTIFRRLEYGEVPGAVKGPRGWLIPPGAMDALRARYARKIPSVPQGEGEQPEQPPRSSGGPQRRRG